MPKPNKSSATSGMKKKQAAKKAAADGTADGPEVKHRPQRGQKGISKADKKKLKNAPKQYVAPPKPPQPVLPDPLDALGLARSLPAELVVSLRRLGKKDAVTRRKALEEILQGWILPIAQKAQGEEEAVDLELKELAVVEAIPVWLHHLPSLLLSPPHRGLALQIHAGLLTQNTTRSTLLNALVLDLLPGPHQVRDILGTWLTAALEEGKRGAGRTGYDGLGAWENTITWDEPSEAAGPGLADGKIAILARLEEIIEYLQMSILRPTELDEEIHPVAVLTDVLQAEKFQKNSKASGKRPQGPPRSTTSSQLDTPDSEDAAKARELESLITYRYTGIQGLRYVLEHLPPDRPLPESLLGLLNDLRLWRMLKPYRSAGVAPESPLVRRAIWALGTCLFKYRSSSVTGNLRQLIGEAMLSSAFREQDGSVWLGSNIAEALVPLLTLYKEVWLDKGAQHDSPDDSREDISDTEEANGNITAEESSEDESDAESIAEGPEGNETAAEQPPKATSPEQNSVGRKAYQDFLNFLQRGCNGSPMEGYPIVLLIVASLPEEVLPNTESAMQALLTSFWAPFYAKLLHTTWTPTGYSSVYAFLSSVMDTLSMLVGRVARAAREADAIFPGWLIEEYARIWKDGILGIATKPFRANRSLHGEKSTEPVQLAEAFGRHLQRLSTIDAACAAEVNDQITNILITATEPQEDLSRSSGRTILFGRLLYLIDAVSTDAEALRQDRSAELASSVLSRLSTASDSSPPEGNGAVDLSLLRSLLDEAHPASLPSGNLKAAVTSFLEASCDRVTQYPVADFAGLLHTFIAWSGEPSMWAALSPRIAKRILQDGTARSFDMANALLIEYAFSAEECEDWQVVLQRACDASVDEDGPSSAVALTRRALGSDVEVPALGTRDTREYVLAVLATALVDISRSSPAKLDQLPERGNRVVSLLQPYCTLHIAEVLRSDVQRAIYPALFRLAFLSSGDDAEALSPPAIALSAANLWSGIISAATADEQAKLFSVVQDDLMDAISDVDAHSQPYAMILALQQLPQEHAAGGKHSLSLLLSDEMLRDTSCWILDSGHLSATMDNLATVPAKRVDATRMGAVDLNGLTRHGRLLEALVTLLAHLRNSVISDSGPLLAIILASTILHEAEQTASEPRGIWSPGLGHEYSEGILDQLDQMISYAVSHITQDADLNWHSTAIATILTPQPTPHPVYEVLRSLAAHTDDSAVHQRALRDTLRRILAASGDTQIAERWLTFAQGNTDKSPATSQAVFAACSPLLSENPKLDRIRSDIASRLAGVPAVKANTVGVRYLRQLQSLVPSLDSVDSFLPQQRGIFLLRHLNGWLVSDDDEIDVSEEVENRIILMYTEMCPIIQDVPGAHWDVIFDLIGTNLEGLDLNDPEGYELAINTLGLFSVLSDLAIRNKALAGTWTDKVAHITCLVSAFTTLAASTPLDFRLRTILDLCLQILDQQLAGGVDDSSADKMYGLLGFPYHKLQLFALRAIRKAVKNRTTALVIELEAGSNDENMEKQKPATPIPAGITSLLSHAERDNHAVLDSTQAFAWTLLFDCFAGASAALRTSYIDQLKELGLVEIQLIPLAMAAMRSLLGTKGGQDDVIALDEYYVELYNPDDNFSSETLALHLLYRALFEAPVLIRTWLEACKDKQVTNYFRGVVLRSFSPTIIEREFSILRTPHAVSQLQDENLTVKVLFGAAEVTVTYVIDEVPMEIVLKMPPEFPLKTVEIRDIQRVGVTQAKWRGWLLNVQQMITSRPGLLLDALTLYKDNITAHFEGKEECAIVSPSHFPVKGDTRLTELTINVSTSAIREWPAMLKGVSLERVHDDDASFEIFQNHFHDRSQAAKESLSDLPSNLPRFLLVPVVQIFEFLNLPLVPINILIEVVLHDPWRSMTI